MGNIIAEILNASSDLLIRFRPEAHVQIGNGSLSMLKQLNEAFTSWLEGYYHLRKHGSTGQSPKDRAEGLKRTMRRVSMIELTEIFLWEESRKVDKTGCVSVFGNIFEVPSHLLVKPSHFAMAGQAYRDIPTSFLECNTIKTLGDDCPVIRLQKI